MNKKRIIATRLFYENMNTDARIVINRGGARSSKSYSIAQLLSYRFAIEKNKRFLIAAKTFPSLKDTAYEMMVNRLVDIGYYNSNWHNRSDHNIYFPYNNNIIRFRSLDRPEKALSTEYNYIWLEEMDRFTYDDYMILRTRLSAPTETYNQLIGSFNPTSALSWIKTKLLAIDPEVKEIVSTYKDNPFLSPEYVRDLEAIQYQNPNYWQIFGLGQWGILEGIIYTDYEILESSPIPEGEIVYGIDFGYNHPMAVIECSKYRDGFLFTELYYEAGQTVGDLIAELPNIIPNKNAYIYADGSRPEMIEDIFRAGYNIYPADRGPGSVKAGIDYLQRHKLYLCGPNIEKEVRQYSWKKNKAGEYLDDPVKLFDDCLDSARYAAYTHFHNERQFLIV